MLLNVPVKSYTHVGTVIEFLDLLFDMEMNDIQALQYQGCHPSGKSQGNRNFFKVRELSGNFGNCQGNLEIQSNVRELSGNFEKLRFKSNF